MTTHERPQEAPTQQGSNGSNSRAGEPWTLQEYQELMDAAAEDVALPDVADTLQRSAGAITARARRALPLNWTRTTSGWWGDLCDLLQDDPQYPWREVLREQGEVLLSSHAIREIESLDRDQDESPTTVAALVGCTHEEAKSLLRRFGRSAKPGPGTAAGRSSSTLKVRNLLPGTSHLPTRGHPTDAGLDLRYAGNEPIRVTAEHQVLLPTGIAVAVPAGYAGLICPRSGLAAKHGLTVVNAPGVVDHGYAGEVKVCLGIVGTENGHTIEPGERIAQLVLTPVLVPQVELVDDLGSSERGTDGFGSTGTR